MGNKGYNNTTTQIILSHVYNMICNRLSRRVFNNNYQFHPRWGAVQSNVGSDNAVQKREVSNKQQKKTGGNFALKISQKNHTGYMEG